MKYLIYLPLLLMLFQCAPKTQYEMSQEERIKQLKYDKLEVGQPLDEFLKEWGEPIEIMEAVQDDNSSIFYYYYYDYIVSFKDDKIIEWKIVNGNRL